MKEEKILQLPVFYPGSKHFINCISGNSTQPRSREKDQQTYSRQTNFAAQCRAREVIRSFGAQESSAVQTLQQVPWSRSPASLVLQTRCWEVYSKFMRPVFIHKPVCRVNTLIHFLERPVFGMGDARVLMSKSSERLEER